MICHCFEVHKNLLFVHRNKKKILVIIPEMNRLIQVLVLNIETGTAKLLSDKKEISRIFLT